MFSTVACQDLLSSPTSLDSVQPCGASVGGQDRARPQAPSHESRQEGRGDPTEREEEEWGHQHKTEKHPTSSNTPCVLSDVQVNSVPVHLNSENPLDVTEAYQRPTVRLRCGVTSVVSSCLICCVLYIHPTITTSDISQIFSYE